MTIVVRYWRKLQIRRRVAAAIGEAADDVLVELAGRVGKIDEQIFGLGGPVRREGVGGRGRVPPDLLPGLEGAISDLAFELEQYARRFAENDIDFSILNELTDQDVQ